ncbi:bile acid:sodium symporter family protein [Pimelobacter simplex]|uniref:Na(+) dependent transporter,Sodium Bile acid symporter family n=1 Tax=Nocardioides simplex TaxID=2045 RepID=A0A0A1DWD5_NOCSI|nr:bile acid:sodium symporter [Pimelobacter simplex]AIY19755.2 Na(+) dependent transporter,Sodium Bile acid symporter family [Pimelobacter simplex]MCG8152875.1 bile acid:sodium symporter family protein [Pimelobacter simplex]GEB11845.1 symporter [Pimelobacter simplex]SFN02515.1 bile acid:Na+ symporter, BASS family [Pimelobacter simplex]
MLAAASDLDALRLSLGQGGQTGIKVLIAVFLLGVALDVRLADLRAVLRRPLVLVGGLAAQFALLPALTLLLCRALDVGGSAALGMLLIACCPAGNLSNLLTHRAHGDVALSIALTTCSNLLAVVATPVAFAFWAARYPAADALLSDIRLDPVEMGVEVALLIGLPFAIGIAVAARRPGLAARLRRPVEIAVLVALLLVIVAGLATRGGVIVAHLDEVAVPAIIQNAVVLLVGYVVGRAFLLPPPGVRAMTFETGIRNTALGLVLALAYFDQLGGVALVVAFWALWDVLTGLLLSTAWRRRPPEPAR